MTKSVKFWKMNGSGNDFIIIDNRDRAVSDENMVTLVTDTCKRRESVGADGVIFIVPSETADFKWRFFNADGSEAEMCGNGSRCVARFAYLNNITGSTMVFETIAGEIMAKVSGRNVQVRMPNPTDLNLDIKISLDDIKTSHQRIGFINTGVPHVVAEVDDIENYPVVSNGRLIRRHNAFTPMGTNVNFVNIVNEHKITVRTYERGVEDETLACGTGCIASALVLAARGFVTSPVHAVTHGGEILSVHFSRDRGGNFLEVWFEGNTTIVYEGILHVEAMPNVF